MKPSRMSALIALMMVLGAFSGCIAMDSGESAPLTPSRAAATGAQGLEGSGGPGQVSGQAAKASPGMFGLPMPQPGDDVVYREPSGNETTDVNLFIGAYEQTHDALGAPRVGQVIGAIHEGTSMQSSDPSARTFSGTGYVIDPVTLDVLATWDRFGLISASWNFTRDTRTLAVPGYAVDSSTLPCGALNFLQGGMAPLNQEILLLPGSCRIGNRGFGAEKATFIGRTDSKDPSIVRFTEQTTRSDVLVLTFRAGQAYPTTIEYGALTTSLQRLKPAAPTPIPAVEGAPVSLPGRVEVTRTASGPELSPDDWPFTLAEAYNAASNDLWFTELRDFQAEHDDAAVYKAWSKRYDSRNGEGQPGERHSIAYFWHFGVTGGDETLIVCASKTVTAPDDPMAPLGDILGGRYAFASGASGCGDSAIGLPPTSDALPATMLDPTAYLHLWPAYMPGRWQDGPARDWGFEFYCTVKDCQDAEVQLWVSDGNATWHNPGHLDPLGDSWFSGTSGVLVIDETGLPRFAQYAP